MLALLRISLEEAVRAMYRLLHDARPGPKGADGPDDPRNTDDDVPEAAPDASTGPGNDLAGDGVEGGPPHDLPDALPALMDRLETLIEEDDSEAVDLFNTHAEALCAALGQPMVTAMGEALRAFEFETALEMLRSARPARDG